MIFDETFSPNIGAVVQWNGRDGVLENGKKYRILKVHKNEHKFTLFVIETWKGDTISYTDGQPIWWKAGDPFLFIREK